MLGTDIRTFNVGDDPIGQRAFDAVQGAPDGKVVTMDFDFPKAGKPAVKQSLGDSRRKSGLRRLLLQIIRLSV